MRLRAILGAFFVLAAALVLPPRAQSVSQVQDLIGRINDHRVATGRPTLQWDDRLAALARRHSVDMARRDFFDHINPDGDDPFDRMDHAGIHYSTAGENLAWGQTTGAQVFEGWMNSRGHRKNLENREFTRIGIGLYQRRWTCLLSRPR